MVSRTYVLSAPSSVMSSTTGTVSPGLAVAGRSLHTSDAPGVPAASTLTVVSQLTCAGATPAIRLNSPTNTCGPSAAPPGTVTSYVNCVSGAAAVAHIT